MKKNVKWLLLLGIMILALIYFLRKEEGETVSNQLPTLIDQSSEVHNSNISVRGVYAVDDSLVWLCGSKSVVGRSITGGRKWDLNFVAAETELELRDIYALDDVVAIAMVSGQPAKFIMTKNTGKTWATVFVDTDEKAFYDGMAFWKDGEGIAFGDPDESGFSIVLIHKDDLSFEKITPVFNDEIIPGTAGFAASGTSIATGADGVVWIATGGSESVVLYSEDYGHSWVKYNVPIISGEPSQGIFSIAVQGNKLVAVGGDYLNPGKVENTIAISNDFGKSWESVTKGANGYKSCVEFIGKDTLVAVGNNSIISFDAGRSWEKFDDRSYHSISKAKNGNSVWLTGAELSIAKLEWIKAE